MSLAFVFIVVAFVVICLASFVYIIIMGPSRYHREGFVGKVYDKLIDSPNVCCGYFLALFFGCNYVRGRQKWRRCADHTLHERNYFMVIFYILLVWPVEILYIFGALPTLRASLLSKVISISLVIVSEFFYALAMFSDPGIVTSRDEEESHRLSYSTQKRKVSKFAKKRMERRTIPDKNTPTTATTTTSNNNNNNNNNSSSGGGAFSPKNRRRYLLSPDAEARQNKRYPVDGILFALACESPSGAVSPKEREAEKGVSCTTCCVPRPSRSKHCRLCNYCVRRFDHHCPWINNDVAEGTHRWFMLFLFCHAVSCLWAAWDLYVIMREFLVANKAWGWVLRLDRGKVFHLSLADYMFILLTHKTLCMCLFWFAIMIGFVLWVFWAYQMMFVTANLTTNDMNKIDDAVDFITNLPPLDAVHAEAMKVRCRLEMIAAKPPRKLQALEAPPEGEVWTGREAERYRKKVHKALQADLRGIYDRGVWKNIMEVLFPYR